MPAAATGVLPWYQRLRREVRRLSQRNRELQQANAELVVEQDAAETLLGVAIDEALKGRHG